MVDNEETKQVNGKAGPIVIALKHKSVIANGDEVKELSFREPTGGDIERCGNPMMLEFGAIGEAPKPKFEPKAMTQMMSVLAAVPPSTIKSMDARDWNTVAYTLAHFFYPD